MRQENKMKLIDVNDFTRETECFFEEERYSVRDNGTVFGNFQDSCRLKQSRFALL